MPETITRQQAVALIESLPSETLPDLAQFADFLRFRTQARAPHAVNADEKRLLAIIERHLTPDQQQRLDLLRQRNDDGTLTDSEHAELQTLVEQIETADAARAQAIIDLAHLRNTSVPTVLRELAPEYVIDAQ